MLSHLMFVETMHSSEREMNPGAVTVINPRKEYWLSLGSNQQPSVPKSAILPTELWGWAYFKFDSTKLMIHRNERKIEYLENLSRTNMLVF